MSTFRITDPLRNEVLSIADYPHNKICCECGKLDPVYVNLTVGSFICVQCCKFLVDLKVGHKIKQLYYSEYTEEEVEKVKKNGNNMVNLIYLLNIPDKHLLKDYSKSSARKEFLKKKYVNQEWRIKDSYALQIAYKCNNQNKKFDSEFIRMLKLYDTLPCSDKVDFDHPRSIISEILRKWGRRDKTVPASSIVASMLRQNGPDRFRPQMPSDDFDQDVRSKKNSKILRRSKTEASFPDFLTNRPQKDDYFPVNQARNYSATKYNEAENQIQQAHTRIANRRRNKCAPIEITTLEQDALMDSYTQRLNEDCEQDFSEIVQRGLNSIHNNYECGNTTDCQNYSQNDNMKVDKYVSPYDEILENNRIFDSSLPSKSLNNLNLENLPKKLRVNCQQNNYQQNNQLLNPQFNKNHIQIQNQQQHFHNNQQQVFHIYISNTSPEAIRNILPGITNPHPTENSQCASVQNHSPQLPEKIVWSNDKRHDEDDFEKYEKQKADDKQSELIDFDQFDNNVHKDFPNLGFLSMN